MNYKALNDIRNSIANHIQFDYRNTAALLNFLHKPISTDGENSFKIAKRLRKKIHNKQVNNLEYLLKRQLGSRSIPEISISEITDFPRIKKYLIVAKILLGTCIRMCKNYLKDLLDNGTAYFVDDKLKENKKNKNAETTKIIAIKLVSRHRRGQTNINDVLQYRPNNLYKIFIEYIAGIDGHKSIKSMYFDDR